MIRHRLPKARLILVEEKTEELIRQLKNAQIDMALLALPVNDEFLQSETLFEDEFLLAVTTDHPLANHNSIEQADLAGRQLLLLDEGHCLRGQALQICQLNQADEQQDVRATNLETLRQMVRAGTGIIFMPRIAIDKSDNGIRYIPFSSPAPSRSIGLVWRKTSTRGELITEIFGLIKQVATELSVT